jgi:hypothetical protein
VPALLEDVAWAQEATTAMEAACVMAVLAVETSAQEATLAWDSATLRIVDAEDRAALAEMEAWERVSREEAENATAFASACKDTEGLVRKIALLEGELAEQRRAQNLANEKSRDLSDMVIDAERRWEVFEREHRVQFKELTLL